MVSAELTSGKDGGAETAAVHRGCEECGSDVSGLSLNSVALSLRQVIEDWLAVLHDDSLRSALSDPLGPGVGSAVELAMGMADLLDEFQSRVFLMLTEESPQFLDWVPPGPSERGVPPNLEMAAAAVFGAGERFVSVFESLRPELSDRTARSADGSNCTVLSVGRYVLHDLLHTLALVTRGLGSVAKGTQ